MKIIWFTNCPVIAQTNTNSGSWLHAYATSLLEHGIKIYVISGCYPTKDELLVPHTWIHGRYHDMITVRSVLHQFKPDLIHVHGTEANFASRLQLSSFSIPVIHSIQGLLHECQRHVVGSIGLVQAIKCLTPVNVLSKSSPFQIAVRFAEKGKIEKTVIRQYSKFIGRTDWDRAHVMSLNPNAKYYHLEEPMRLPFYQEPRRYTVPGRIYVTSGDISYKGGHIAIQALNIIRQFIPEAHLHISGVAPKKGLRGSGYLKWLQRDITKLGLCDCVTWLGAINADQMVRELNEAHVHLTPSFIDNSPNSTQEAMLQATPCVISYTGGTPSLASESETALFFPSGDAAVCAYKMLWLMEHREEAEAMGQRARKLGLIRNDRDMISQRLIDIYNEVVDGES